MSAAEMGWTALGRISREKSRARRGFLGFAAGAAAGPALSGGGGGGGGRARRGSGGLLLHLGELRFQLAHLGTSLLHGSHCRACICKGAHTRRLAQSPVLSSYTSRRGAGGSSSFGSSVTEAALLLKAAYLEDILFLVSRCCSATYGGGGREEAGSWPTVVVGQVAEVDDVPLPLGALPRLRGALLRRQDGHKLEVAVVVGRGRGRRRRGRCDRRRRRGRRGRRRRGRGGRGVVEAAVVVEEGRQRADDGLLVVRGAIYHAARQGAHGAALLLRVRLIKYQVARGAQLEFAVARLLPAE